MGLRLNGPSQPSPLSKYEHGFSITGVLIVSVCPWFTGVPLLCSVRSIPPALSGNSILTYPEWSSLEEDRLKSYLINSVYPFPLSLYSVSVLTGYRQGADSHNPLRFLEHDCSCSLAVFIVTDARRLISISFISRFGIGMQTLPSLLQSG